MSAAASVYGAFVLVEQLPGASPEVFRAHRCVGDEFSGPLELARYETQDRALTEALVRAARWAERCRHPGVTRILEVGRLAGYLYAVTERRDGIDLERVLFESVLRGVPIPVSFIAGIGAQLAALCRDLHHIRDADAPLLLEGARPADVIVTWDGRVRMRFLRGRGGAGGDPHEVHRPPERDLGHPVTERTDIWLIGRLLRTLLTGDGESSSPCHDRTGLRALTQKLLSAMLSRSPGDRPDMRGVERWFTELLEDAGEPSARAAVAAFVSGRLGDVHPRTDVSEALRESQSIIEPLELAAPDLLYPLPKGALDAWETAETTDLFKRPSLSELQALVVAPTPSRPRAFNDQGDETSSGDPFPHEDGNVDLDAIASSYIESMGEAPPEEDNVVGTPSATAGFPSPQDTLVTSLPRPLVVGRAPPRWLLTSAEEASLGPLDELPFADVERTYAADEPRDAAKHPAEPAADAFEAAPTFFYAVSPASATDVPATEGGSSVFTRGGHAVAESADAPSRQRGPPIEETTELWSNACELPLSPPTSPGEGTQVFKGVVAARAEATVQLDAAYARAALARALGRQAPTVVVEDTSFERTLGVSRLLPTDTADSEVEDLATSAPSTSAMARTVRSVDEEQLGVLVIEAPQDALVYVNGVEQGQGRVVVTELDRFASYQVRVHCQGHYPWTAAVGLRGRPAARIVPELTPR